MVFLCKIFQGKCDFGGMGGCGVNGLIIMYNVGEIVCIVDDLKVVVVYYYVYYLICFVSQFYINELVCNFFCFIGVVFCQQLQGFVFDFVFFVGGYGFYGVGVV